VFVVKETNKSSFDLSSAAPTINNNYTVVSANNSNKQFVLTASCNDSDGSLIIEAINYAVFVISVADGTIVVNNTLSPASLSIKLEQVEVPRNSWTIDQLSAELSGLINNHLQFMDERYMTGTYLN
jgi:hypothetical protein